MMEFNEGLLKFIFLFYKKWFLKVNNDIKIINICIFFIYRLLRVDIFFEYILIKSWNIIISEVIKKKKKYNY